MSIYITGGCGFIGSNLIKHLNSIGIDDIFIIDNFGSNNKWKNIVDLKFKDLIFPEKFNILDIKFKDTVIHLGACSNTKEQNVDFLWSNNTQLSINIINHCISNRTRLIYASSAAVYGDGTLGFNDSDDITPNLKPLNPYGFSKLKVDQYIINNNLISQNKIAGLRFFNVWGLREEHKENMRSFPSRVKELIKTNSPIIVYQDPIVKLKRDFVYVKDVCSIIVKFIDNKYINGIFNVGSGQSNSWLDIAEVINKELGTKSTIEIKPLPVDLKNQYQFFTEANIEKILEVLPDITFTPFDIALKEFAKEEI